MGDYTSNGPTRVILVGIGGATCSGKTTLAKHLKHILPNSVIIHQDDFAPPQESVPMHPDPSYHVQDWDAPAGAIQWPRMAAFLRNVKQTGVIPPDHRSHDHLNEQKEVSLPEEFKIRWSEAFLEAQEYAERKGERIIWGLVDGFLLYWNPEIYEQLDVRIFLRVPQTVLKQRRHERHGYHTAVQSDPEGSLWRDPPQYWERIVWPAYLEANRKLFVDEDVENGGPSGKVKELVMLNATQMSMSEIVEGCCEVLKAALDNI